MAGIDRTGCLAGDALADRPGAGYRGIGTPHRRPGYPDDQAYPVSWPDLTTPGRPNVRFPSGDNTPKRKREFTPDTVLAGIGAGALLCVVWPIWVSGHGPAPIHATTLIAHVCGMAAGYGVIVLIGLMSRTPALERGVGADRLARWHSRGGCAVVVLVLVHAWAAVAAWADAQKESLPLASWHVLRMPWLVSATVGTVALVVVAAISIRIARRRVRFERWHSIHLLTYIAVALGFVHQLAGPDLAGRRPLQVMWALLYTLVFSQVLMHRVVTPLRNGTRHRMRVAALVQEAPGVVSIVIQGRNLEELDAESGQFFRWRFLTPDSWWTAHPFSLSAPPTSTQLRLTVKALGDGSGALQRLEAGTWVIAEGPYGAMTAARRTRRDVLLIAGGVGITPMRALFETLPLAPGQDLLLLYRVRAGQAIVFRDELETIARQRGARLRYLDGAGVGPFTPALFHRLVPNVLERDVYLCGPPGMADAVRDALRGAGLAPEQLHEENFDF